MYYAQLHELSKFILGKVKEESWLASFEHLGTRLKVGMSRH